MNGRKKGWKSKKKKKSPNKLVNFPLFFVVFNRLPIPGYDGCKSLLVSTKSATPPSSAPPQTSNKNQPTNQPTQKYNISMHRFVRTIQMKLKGVFMSQNSYIMCMFAD